MVDGSPGSGGEVEQSFDLDDGERDQPGIGRWRLGPAGRAARRRCMAGLVMRLRALSLGAGAPGSWPSESAARAVRVTDETGGQAAGPGQPHRDAPPHRFVRLDEARTRIDGGGTGLGLTIAWEMATAHDGTLTAETPELGRAGARLVLTVPTGRNGIHGFTPVRSS